MRGGWESNLWLLVKQASDTMSRNSLNQKLKLMVEASGYVVYSNTELYVKDKEVEFKVFSPRLNQQLVRIQLGVWHIQQSWILKRRADIPAGTSIHMQVHRSANNLISENLILKILNHVIRWTMSSKLCSILGYSGLFRAPLKQITNSKGEWANESCYIANTNYR